MRFSGWRLTPDPGDDPHAEAARYALGGRPSMAASVLRAAIAKQPERTDLQVHLQRIEADSKAGATRNAKPTVVANLFVVAHAFVAWALFLGLLVGFLVGLPAFLKPLLPPLEHFTQSLPAWALVVGIAVVVFWVFSAVAITIHLFCRLWFGYLRNLPEAHALAADAVLPSVITTWQFGGVYKRARQVFYAERYGSATQLHGSGNA